MHAMKRLVPKPLFSQDWDSAPDSPDDIARLVRAAAAAGFVLFAEDAVVLWRRHSEDVCAGWLTLEGEEDSALVQQLLKQAVVVEQPKNAPPPPQGYASWLDYAVATLDNNSIALQCLFDEQSGPPTREDMLRAAKWELSELRRLAGHSD